MIKIRKIQFDNHPVLGNLELDFCDSTGKAVDTVIIAGANGTGKSSILNCLFGLASDNPRNIKSFEIEEEEKTSTITFYKHPRHDGIWVKDDSGLNTIVGSQDYKRKYSFLGVFSDVAINFNARNISSVTSMDLDTENGSRKTSNDFPTLIKQLIIDIQALDDAEIAKLVKENHSVPYDELSIEQRMSRFTAAFSKMFDSLSYSRIENKNGSKSILFTKNGRDIPIDDLSSGEKQIVYRGCFFLKDSNALNGALVFIDEPEISLHPDWQKKIMDYYKGIFTDSQGNQTSQIFAVTHSPFIIHNESRRNDKVIVLSRDESGSIIVIDKPEYYKCDTIEAVSDAFDLRNFKPEKPTVYVEGRTDQKYFKRALEVFQFGVPFEFEWIGYIDDRGQECNTGKDSLQKAVHFLIGRNIPTKSACLFDCDTNKTTEIKNNVIITAITQYENSKRIKKGIENALILDSIELKDYYYYTEKEDDYGGSIRRKELKKMELCDYICGLDDDDAKVVLKNLEEEINQLKTLFASQ